MTHENTLTTAKRHIDHFITKANRTNDPLVRFKRTGIPTALKENVKGGLIREVLVLIDKLRTLNDPNIFPDTLEPLTDEQIARLKSYIYADTPGIRRFVSESAIYVKLRSAFEYSVGSQYQSWGLGKVKITQNKEMLKATTFYRGEEGGLAGAFHMNGTNLLGNALYVSNNEAQARMFGNIVSKYEMNIKPSQILHIDTDDALTKIIGKALHAFPGEDVQTSIPKYIMKQGYKMAQIAPSVEPRGGIAVFDQKIIDSAKISRLPDTSAGVLSDESGFISIGKSNFSLTNPRYIAELRSSSNYLLQQSNLDETTRNQIIDIITRGKLDALTNDEIGDLLLDQFDDIAEWRADMIARTEVANAMSNAQMATMQENGVPTKAWIIAGKGDDEICAGNEDDGFIPIDQNFSSGDDSPPGHPNCECYLEAGEIDLNSISIWEGE